MTPDEQEVILQRQKRKNIAVGLALMSFVILIFVITFVKQASI